MSKKVIPIAPISRNGKGSFPRFNYQSDETYKKNFEAIFGKKKNEPSRSS